MEAVNQIPNWLIWASYLSALLAIPGAIAAFITLFVKDKSKQKQIDKLTEIAESLDSQNSILSETLNLYRNQLKILTDLYNLNEISSVQQEKMNELEKEIKLVQMKPILQYAGGMNSPREVKINLNVTNADVVDLSSEVEANDQIIIRNKGPYDIAVGNIYSLVIQSKSNENANKLIGRLKLSYSDRLENKYQQVIHLNAGHVNAEKAELINNGKSN